MSPRPDPHIGPVGDYGQRTGSVTVNTAGQVQQVSADLGQGDPLTWSRGDQTASSTHDGAISQENQAALDLLQQALDSLAAATNTDDIVRQLTSVYAMANNLQHSETWSPGLQQEFEAWLPYEVSSAAVDQYTVARDAVHQAGAAVHAAAQQWVSANANQRLRGAMWPGLEQPLVGIGAALRSQIDAAHQAIATANQNDLNLLNQAVSDLAAASDPDIVVRDAGTVFTMVNNLLHGDQWQDPALADEVRAWVALTPTPAATTARDPLVTGAQTFAQSAQQMTAWYPYHALRGWAEAPVQDLLAAGTAARTAIGTP